jgi:glycerol kinase
MLIAIDQGTSSSRVIAYNPDGSKAFTKQYPYELNYPNPHWVELDGNLLWQTTEKALREVLAFANNIKAIGITNQRETLLFWDKYTGKAVLPGIVWQDRRTSDFCKTLQDRKNWFYDKTGLLPDPYFSLTKLDWVFKNHPAIKADILSNKVLIGTVDTFLLWQLTQGNSYKTDVTNASRTLFFNIHDLCWDEDICQEFGIPIEILPEVVDSDAWMGEYEGIPIHGMIGDQQSALLGQACFSPGDCKATYGTGGFIMGNIGEACPKEFNGLLTTVAYKIQNQTAYALEGSIFQAGTIMKWLKNELQLVESYQEIDVLIASVADNGGVYLNPGFTGLGAPFWYDVNGASYHGITLQTKKAHLIRACLEAIAYQTKAILDKLPDSIHLKQLKVDGGMVSNQWFLGFMRALMGVDIFVPEDHELTAKGAAMLAGVGIGIYPNVESTAKLWEGHKQSMPTNLFGLDKSYSDWLSIMNQR